MDIHPLAEIFPLIEGDAFREFTRDIRENGLRAPIVTCDGKVLDGRNRLRACQEIGIEPAVIAFDGTDPLAFVVSQNLRRRHLKDSQRALIAARLANMPQGGRTDRGAQPGRISQSAAAALLNVRPRTLQWGRQVEAGGIPELHQLVARGQLSISAAGKVARLSDAEQRRIVADGPSAIVARARRMDRLAGRQGRSEYAILWDRIVKICDGLEAARLDLAHVEASGLVKELERIAASRRQ